MTFMKILNYDEFKDFAYLETESTKKHEIIQVGETKYMIVNFEPYELDCAKAYRIISQNVNTETAMAVPIKNKTKLEKIIKFYYEDEIQTVITHMPEVSNYLPSEMVKLWHDNRFEWETEI